MPEVLVRGYRCAKCGHEWAPRRGRGKPKVCPVCKSESWDEEVSHDDNAENGN